ncbi:MAG: zf-HC2 domain-containing protein [Candidatus Omnitrophica bacterium]|nr:zf-HC2 domain-containing protein [Candidatus Omnitrophota bacterium]
MLCKNIQELIKSDYLDKEIDEAALRQVKEHLAACPFCREMEERLQAQRRIFQSATRFEPPKRIWLNIQDAIVSERMANEDSAKSGIIERLRGLLGPRRPIFALASVLAVTIFVVVLAGGLINKQQFLDRAGSSDIFSVYGFSSDSNYPAGDMGTSIEKYFL